MIDPDDTQDPYALPEPGTHPATIAERIKKNPVHAHLAENEITFGWLMRTEPKVKAGKTVLGSIHDTKTMAQGGFKDLFAMLLGRLLGDLPDYIVVLDLEFWKAANETQREAVVWHELAHCQHALDQYGAPRFDRDGMPVYALVAHDIEAFRSEVERFGAWTSDIAEFIASARNV